MYSSKAIFVVVVSIALVSGAPNGLLGGLGLGDTIGGGEGGLGGIIGGEGGIGGILGGITGGENGGIGGIVNGLLGGNQDVLDNLLRVLGGSPGGLGLPLTGNLTELPTFLTKFLEDLPTPLLEKITGILSDDTLNINEITSQLTDLLSGQNQDVLATLLSTVTNLISELLSGVSEVVANLGSVFDQLTQILNNQDQTLLQQNEAIENLRKQFPIELEAIFLIASRVAKTLQVGNGGVVPELPVPLPETPQVPD
ncbi:hypothetical protein GCK72_020044 [Caenorhabditis remanei]|uniref:SXP/RAL-2 family protein Ani s 5-like cation-binding domain-containing protein n=1 Tax=Caenorhabditis remanei TaxID=31234 RepID=A0A6A5GE26_CAERE|nr:hypothetical protein GCK72_020044 [Caenorhabditis remanei]KAF1753487.1 hypothetical protein GCK72_020044 [Caenorhabditis remanei]